MTGEDAIREIAQRARDYVQTVGMFSVTLSPDKGWTIIATRDGVSLSHPGGVLPLPVAFLDGGPPPAELVALDLPENVG